jgi:membrane glycosyltransferase
MTDQNLALLPLAPEAPLDMPDQDFRRSFRDPAAVALPRQPRVVLARIFSLLLAAGMTLALGSAFADWFVTDGRLTAVEVLLTGLTCFTFFWVALSVATALLGLLYRRADVPGAVPALRIAVLLPMYGEPAERTIGAAVALLRGLRAGGGAHSYALHVLSDTRDPALQAAEAKAVHRLLRQEPGLPVFYRLRPANTDFKPGNVRDWVSRHGGGWDAMLVLDADSVMAPDAVRALADALAADTATGLVQSIPRLIHGRTLFQRMQQFANTVHGANLGRGLALWSGTEANFWGHNAIIRTRAFAASAGLPRLSGRRPFGGTILSHDFVEAALIRRAGWAVRFLPEAEASYEETPPTVADYVRRDRRWCQGNLQHLRLLAVRGLHPASRFHLMQGAMAYLASLGWFAVLVLWALTGDETAAGILSYFSPDNPHYPSWPEMPGVTRAAVMAFIYGMLVAPKLVGAFAWWLEDRRLAGTGGPLVFAASLLAEMLLSVLLAPMMMVQHVQAVIRTLAGRDTGWAPKGDAALDLRVLLRFHAAETVLGLVMLAAAGAGYLSLWLLPIAACLALSVPLALLMAVDARRWPLFRTPQERVPRARGSGGRVTAAGNA